VIRYDTYQTDGGIDKRINDRETPCVTHMFDVGLGDKQG
jgi:hypothetical protein